MKIQLINPDSLTLRLDLEKTAKAGQAVYERTTNKFKFLLDTDLCEIDRHGYTNLGSTPRFLHSIKYFEPWRYACSYATHDDGYEEEGMYINGVLTKMTREYIDEILINMIIAEGEWQNRKTQARFVAPIIYSGVRIGGWNAWNGYRKIKNAK